jgi:hypothetical protein
MSRKLMIALATIGIVASSAATAALAAPYHGVEPARGFSTLNASAPAERAGRSAQPGYQGFRRDSCGHIDDVCNSSKYFG